MKNISLLMSICLLTMAGCKKEDKSMTGLLTNGKYKDWQRYQYKQGTASPKILDDCYRDDVWRFYANGKLEVDLSGTNCGGFGITGPVVYATWKFNSTQDTLTWTYNATMQSFAFQINALNKSELIVYQRVDSTGNTGTPQSTIDMLNYFIQR